MKLNSFYFHYHLHLFHFLSALKFSDIHSNNTKKKLTKHQKNQTQLFNI